MTELAGMRSFDNLAKTDIVLSSSEAEDLEAAVRSFVEATSWIDWWTFTAKSMALQSFQEVRMLKPLFSCWCEVPAAGGEDCIYCMGELNTKTVRCVFTEVKDSVSFEFFMDFMNSPLCGSLELFPAEAIEKAIEKSLRFFMTRPSRRP